MSKRRGRSGREAGPWWLSYLEEHDPAWFRKLEVWVLFHLTAKVLGATPPSLAGKGYVECLSFYQRYTGSLGCLLEEGAIESGKALREALYRRAFRLGRLLSFLPGLSTDERRWRFIQLLYKNIGITLEGELPGVFLVPSCSFQPFYTPKVCLFMSGFDAGVICGIFGGGELCFQERLTEGYGRCRGCYKGRETVR